MSQNVYSSVLNPRRYPKKVVSISPDLNQISYSMDRFKLTLVDMMEIPQAYDAEFLGDIAEKLDLSPLSRCIFTERLSQQNLDANWTDIVESCQPRLTPDQARKDNWSRQILPKLRELGFDHDANAKKTVAGRASLVSRESLSSLAVGQTQPDITEDATDGN